MSATTKLSEPAAEFHAPENSKVNNNEADAQRPVTRELQPMTDKDWLDLYYNPKKFNFTKWTTIPKWRRALNESTAGVSGSESGLDSVANVGELTQKYGNRTRPLTSRSRQTRQQGAEERVRRSSPDTKSLIDRLLDGEIEIEEFWETPLSQKCMPSPKTSVSKGQRKHEEEMTRYSEDERKSLSPAEGESDWEGSSVSSTPPQITCSRDVPRMFDNPTRWEKVEETPQKKLSDVSIEVDELIKDELKCEQSRHCQSYRNPNDRDLLAMFENPIKGSQSMKPRQWQREEEAQKRYEDACQSTPSGLSSSPRRKRCDTPAPRQMLNSQIADSSRWRH